MMPLFEWILSVASTIVGCKISGYLYEQIWHRPIYRNKKAGITLWVKGDPEDLEKLLLSYVEQFGPDDRTKS